MSVKLSPKSLKELPGPATGRPWVIHYDADVPGFGVRITAAGARSLVVNFRANGVERRMTIGSIPEGAGVEEVRRLVDDARKKAARIKAGAKYEGNDPMAARHEDRAAATISGLCDRYISDHLPKKRPSSQRDDKSMIESIIRPAMRNRRVSAIRYADIDDLHRELSQDAPVRANRVVALLSKMFALSIKWGWRTDNPARGIDRNPEDRRQRYLSPQELERLATALANHSRKSSANAIRLLLLTGARRGEVLTATWSQFDLEEGIWIKPSSHTKQKKEHRLPLSAPARQLLAEMKAEAIKVAKEEKREISQFVFPGGGNGETQTDLKRTWASVCKMANISGVRVHDLRHTYASVLVNAGYSLPLIGQLLGHTNPGTTARYAHLFDDPLRAAAERAASIIGGSSSGPMAEIVSLGHRR